MITVELSFTAFQCPPHQEDSACVGMAPVVAQTGGLSSIQAVDHYRLSSRNRGMEKARLAHPIPTSQGEALPEQQ